MTQPTRSPTAVIRGGRVLDIRKRSAEPADLLVVEGAIDAIGPPGLPAPEGAALVDASRRLIMPGLVNAHTHGHGALGKGMGDRWTLELLLNAGPRLTVHETHEHKYLTALVNALEMVRKGCTACYDLFLELPVVTPEGVEAAAQGYADAGMRAVVAPMMADRTFLEAVPGLMEALPDTLRRDVERIRAAPAASHLEACARLLRGWSPPRERIAPALAPTVPLHCSDAFLLGCRDLAGEHGVGLHMHLAESKVQAVSGIERYGRTLAAHLDELGFLGPSFTAAHAVWLDDDDIRRLAGHGASVAHNPGSNLRLGSGIAPAREMHRAGLEVGIGTDGSTCADNQNMFEAMRFAAYVSRARSVDPGDWLAADEVLAMATEGGARVLGFGDRIGRIAPGYRADLVFLDLDHVNWLPMNDPCNQIVNTEDGSAVDGVMVDGEAVLWKGRFTRVDLDTLRRDVERAVEELRRIASGRSALPLALEAHVSRYCVGLARRDYHVEGLVG